MAKIGNLLEQIQKKKQQATENAKSIHKTPDQLLNDVLSEKQSGNLKTATSKNDQVEIKPTTSTQYLSEKNNQKEEHASQELSSGSQNTAKSKIDQAEILPTAFEIRLDEEINLKTATPKNDQVEIKPTTSTQYLSEKNDQKEEHASQELSSDSQNTARSKIDQAEIFPTTFNLAPTSDDLERAEKQNESKNSFSDSLNTTKAKNAEHLTPEKIEEEQESLVVEGAFFRDREFENLPEFVKNQTYVNETGGVSHISDGFLQRSHVFRALRIVLSPSEFVLFDYFYDSGWDGNKNGITRQSLSRLSERTSLSLTTIKQCLKSLEARNLLKVVEVNMKLGNLYKVAKLTKSKSVQAKSRLSLNLPTSQPNDDQAPSRNSATCKESLSKEPFVKNSLSLHAGFNDRWNNIPKRTREREMEVISFLIKKFPNDIQDLFEEVQSLETTGVDRFGKPCGSPIGLIESSWPAIRAIRQERRQKEEQDKEKQAQKAHTNKEERVRILEEQVRTETDALVLERYDNLSEEELDAYLLRARKQNPTLKAAKGTPAATGLIKELIRDDLKLHEYEVRKLAELSLSQQIQ